MIKGGTANNIIPGNCTIDWEARLLPEHDVKEITDRIDAFAKTLEPAMKAVSPDAGIKTALENTIPGLAPEENSQLESLIHFLAQANGSQVVSYGTEAGLFQMAGMSTIVCGPGSIDQAHKADEFVEISQMEKCDVFMQRLASHCSD